MPYFCFHDHPQLPVVHVTVRPSAVRQTKDGFRLRYALKIPAELEAHGNHVIGEIDSRMGRATRAHGVYQARFEDVIAAYVGLLKEAGPAKPPRDLALRQLALVAALLLTAARCAIMPAAFIGWTIVVAMRHHTSALRVMAETAVIDHVLDWRPLIWRLLHYWRHG